MKFLIVINHPSSCSVGTEAPFHPD